ncbi:MAG: AAA family ATPase [Pseudanabaena sp. CAN_BIN31]|nr:AAA family ATPase [Pseudanabaena sp. CAN_BIN31]
MVSSSKWNIWDFHLHTPRSILNNRFGNPEESSTWDAYIREVEKKVKEKGIAALGITDYFTIEGYKKVKEMQENGHLQDVLIFPNIEFRVDKIIYSSKSKNNTQATHGGRLNIHVLFSPDISIKAIEEGFLHDLDFCYEQEPFEKSKMRKLKLPNLIEFGESLQENHPKFKSESALWVGCNNAVVKTEQIKEELDQKFKGKYMLVLADEDLSEMSWDGQDHATRKQLVQMSHAIFSSGSKTIDFCLGKKHASPEEFIQEFKSLKPCFWGCDSHSFEERFLEPDKSRYCWIKAQPSWEGLKQVLYEPSERVKIQPDNPEHTKSSFTIRSLKIEKTKLTESLTIDEFYVDLNSNLVTIIGGRGSGKTALLDIIASCFGDGKKLQKISNSFINRLYGGKESKNKPNVEPISVSLNFKSGESFSCKVAKEVIKPFERSDIHYLTQNHFEEYSADPTRLNSHVLGLIFENLPDEKIKYDQKFTEIKQIENKIQTINLRIEQLNIEINRDEVELITKHKIKVGEKDDITQRIATIEEQKGKEQNEIQLLTSALESLKQKKRSMEEILPSFALLNSEIETFENSYSSHVAKLNKQIEDLNISDELKSLSCNFDELLKVKTVLFDNAQFLTTYKEKLENDISSRNQEISKLEGANKEIAEYRQKLSNLNLEIQETEANISQVNEKKSKVLQLVTQRINLYADIMTQMSILRIFLQQVIDKFEHGRDEILNKLQFVASVDTKNKTEYIQNLSNKLDNRKHSQNEIINIFSKIFDSMEDIMNVSSNVNDNESRNIYRAISEKIYEATKDLSLKSATSLSDYNNSVFHRFFDLVVNIKFDNKAIENLSMGERAIVLLKILLALDDTPLLIDQPEEHLDNRFIYDELKDAFRIAKKRRQIIIATHNANLVINTDAEQIIIAKPLNGTIQYTCGTIEDLKIREDITQILEGGEAAFKKREEKYGYKF